MTQRAMGKYPQSRLILRDRNLGHPKEGQPKDRDSNKIGPQSKRLETVTAVPILETMTWQLKSF